MKVGVAPSYEPRSTECNHSVRTDSVTLHECHDFSDDGTCFCECINQDCVSDPQRRGHACPRNSQACLSGAF
jgi:hypothetical protein